MTYRINCRFSAEARLQPPPQSRPQKKRLQCSIGVCGRAFTSIPSLQLQAKISPNFCPKNRVKYGSRVPCIPAKWPSTIDIVGRRIHGIAKALHDGSFSGAHLGTVDVRVVVHATQVQRTVNHV